MAYYTLKENEPRGTTIIVNTTVVTGLGPVKSYDRYDGVGDVTVGPAGELGIWNIHNEIGVSRRRGELVTTYAPGNWETYTWSDAVELEA